MASQESPDQELKKAAIEGDVEFLKKCVASKKSNEYYLTYFPQEDDANHYGNIFHLAAEENREKFIREAIKILPSEVIQELIQPSSDILLWNPLHEAAKVGNIAIVKIFLDVYTSLPSLPSDHSKRPWLMRNSSGYTPCQTALINGHEECALEIYKMDKEELCKVISDDNSSLLYTAVLNGFNKLALEILKSSYPFACDGYKGNTPLHWVAKCSEKTEEIFRLLLEREPGLINQRTKYGASIFHSWASDYKELPFKCLLQSKNIPDVRRVFAELVAATDKDGDNPLHSLVSYNQRPEDRLVKVAQLLIETYKEEASNLSNETLPWLAKNSDNETPLSLAIQHNYQKFALYILSVDNDAVIACQENALFLAIKSGCHDVAGKILEIVDNKKWNHLLINEKEETALHLAPLLTNNETFFKRLLDGHPEFIEKYDKDGNTVLHYWLRKGAVWQIEDLLKSEWRSHIIKIVDDANYNEQNNPFHVAAISIHKGTLDVLKLLVGAFKEENPDWRFNDLCWMPWFCTNKNNDGPLHLAMRKGNEELATYFLSLHAERDDTITELLDYYTPKHKTLFLAIESNCPRVAQEILEKLEGLRWKKYLMDASDGRNVLHLGPKCKDQVFGKWLIEKASKFIIKPDKSKITPLEYACDIGAAWFIEEIRKKYTSAFNSKPLAWQRSCKQGHIPAIRAFIDYNPGKFRDLCIENQDTPLHHIQLQSLTEYEEFLKIPRMNKDLINLQNKGGETPLHVAVKSENILLTETLLGMNNIRHNIKDSNKKTARDLLAEVCKRNKKWEIMCHRVEFDPYITTSYVQRKTNLLDIRNSLFVVAALLATITFTAGFTLPGGLNDDGEAVLIKRVSFVVFMISNTLAMCTSMLVLICLVWSMVHGSSKSLVLIDRSMVILMVAFYSTLLAFTTGVYLVISKRALWLAILVVIMCGLIGLSAYRTLLYKVLHVPARRKKNNQQDSIHLMEQGLANNELNPLLGPNEENSTQSSESDTESSEDSNTDDSDEDDDEETSDEEDSNEEDSDEK